MDHELKARLKTLDRFIAQAQALPEDDQLKSYLCRLGTVLICGNIEQSVQIIILSRLRPKAHDHVLNFIKSHFKRGQNLDCEAIQQLLTRFDSGWYKAFSKFVDGSPGLKDGISSCYAIRNSTAHGGSQSVGIRGLKEMFETHKLLIDGLIMATAIWGG